MNGNRKPSYLLDTKVAIYYIGGRLVTPLPAGRYALSIITEIELLSYPKLSVQEEARIRQFLNRLTIVEINQEVKDYTISFRKQYRLKLPDALIAATAKFVDAPLITNDVALLQMPEIATQAVQIQ